MGSGRAGQTKRLQQTVYRIIQDEGPATADALARRFNARPYHTNKQIRGQNHGTNSRRLAAVMATSVLFRPVGLVYIPTIGQVNLWGAVPLEEAAAKAIASKRPIHKYPLMLRKAMKEMIQ